MGIRISILLLVVLPASFTSAWARGIPHVRTFDPGIRSAIDHGVERSALFRGLIAQLDASDVIVYAEVDCLMSEQLQGRLTFMTAAGGFRYVKVAIACRLDRRRQIAMLAHELRHAMEIAVASGVVDERSLEKEYRRIGFTSSGASRGASYDSRAAIETGRRVWREVEAGAD